MGLKNWWATTHAGWRPRRGNRYGPRVNTPKIQRHEELDLRRLKEGREVAHPKGHFAWYAGGRKRKTDRRPQRVIDLEYFLGHPVRPRKMGRVR